MIKILNPTEYSNINQLRNNYFLFMAHLLTYIYIYICISQSSQNSSDERRGPSKMGHYGRIDLLWQGNGNDGGRKQLDYLD